MKQVKFFGLLMTVLLLASCNNGDNEATGTGDVMIVAKQSGTNTIYGLSIYAYTFSSFSSVTALNTSQPEKTYTLKSNDGFKTSFSYETPANGFTTTKPASGTFNFSADFENGVHQEFQNVLSADVLPVPVVEKCEYNPAEHQMEINWTLIPAATSYSIQILDGSEIVFASVEMKDVVKGAYAKKTSGGGWAAGFTPVNGKTYTVRLFAYLYEPGGGVYNMQAISIAEKTVVWGD